MDWGSERGCLVAENWNLLQLDLSPLAGRRVLIVDDVITAGTAISQALVCIADAGGIAATAWPRVIAARFTLSLQSKESVSTGGAPLTRQLIHVVTLRNRLS